MDDDLNSPILLSHLFEAVRIVNSASDGSEKLGEKEISDLKDLLKTFVYDILGLKSESGGKDDQKLTGDLMNIIISLRKDARDKKDFATSDKIRNELNKIGIVLKDKKEGPPDWEISE